MDPAVWHEKQVAHISAPEVYHNVEKEHHVVPRYDAVEKQVIAIEQAETGITSAKKTVTLSRKSVIIGVVALIVLIGALVGGLVGGLMSRKNTTSSVAQETPTTSAAPVTSSNPSTSTTIPSSSTATKASIFTTTAAPASYPSSLSSSNLVQNPEFERGFQYWSDPQHCWQSTDNPSGTSSGEPEIIARVYDNNQNPGNACSLTQTIATVGAGDFVLAFRWGTYYNNSVDAAERGGRFTVRAGGKSLPALLLNTTFSVPGRYEGFPVAAYKITTFEEDFVIDFAGWSGGSVWDVAMVQLTRS